MRLEKSRLIEWVLVAYCFVWLFDPIYFGVLGYEGALRWGALAAIVAVAILTPGTGRFLVTATFGYQVLFVSVALVSVAVAGGGSGYVEVLRLAPTCLAAPLVAYASSASPTRRLQNVLLGFLTVFCVLSIASGYLGGRFVAGRLFGLSWHPNALSLAAAVACSIALFGFDKLRWPQLLAFAIGAATVYLTDSALGQITVVLTLVGRLVALAVGQRSIPAYMTMVSLLAIAAPLLIAMSLVDYRNLVNIVDRSTYGRLGIWYGALQTFLQDPVLGSGFGGGQSLEDVYSQESVYYSHSVMLNYLRTTGVVGLFALLLLLIHVTRRAAASWRTGGRPAMLFLFPVLMFSSVEAGLQQMPVSWVLLWIAAGYALSRPEPPVKESVGLMPATSISG